MNLDLRLMKGFWVKDGRAIVQVGVEAFNLLNHSNALRVSPFFSSRGDAASCLQGSPDRRRLAIDDGQQDASGPLGSASTLLPISYCRRADAEARGEIFL